MILVNPFLRRIEIFYQFLIKIGSHLQSVFLLYMRVVWGHQLFVIGIAKLGNIEKVTQFFATLHIPLPQFHAYFVAVSELIFGLFLFFGFASRLSAIPILIIMLTALSTAHAPTLSNFRFLLDPHLLVRQEPYPFLIMAFLVLAFGPGRVSIDALLSRWIAKQPRY